VINHLNNIKVYIVGNVRGRTPLFRPILRHDNLVAFDVGVAVGGLVQFLGPRRYPVLRRNIFKLAFFMGFKSVKHRDCHYDHLVRFDVWGYGDDQVSVAIILECEVAIDREANRGQGSKEEPEAHVKANELRTYN
jgi:hypothetical protein